MLSQAIVPVGLPALQANLAGLQSPQAGQLLVPQARLGSRLSPEFQKEMDDFIEGNEVDERAAANFRSQPIHIVRAVIELGPLHTTRNPSASLMGRIKKAKEHIDNVRQEVSALVDVFLSREEDVDDRAAAQLRAQEPHVQLVIMDKGTLATAQSGSRSLMGRVKKALEPGASDSRLKIYSIGSSLSSPPSVIAAPSSMASMPQLALMNTAHNSINPTSSASALPLMGQMSAGKLNPTPAVPLPNPMLSMTSPSLISGLAGNQSSLYGSAMTCAPATVATPLAGSLGAPGGLSTSGGTLMGAPASSANLSAIAGSLGAPAVLGTAGAAASAANLGGALQPIPSSLGATGGLGTAVASSMGACAGASLLGAQAASANLPAMAVSLGASAALGTASPLVSTANLGGALPAIPSSLGATGGWGTAVASSTGAGAAAANLGASLQASVGSLSALGMLGTSATSSAVPAGGFMFDQLGQLQRAGVYGAMPTLGVMSGSMRAAPY